MMDVDVDQDLVSKFSSMGTTDRDVLINEFQRLSGNNLNPATCAFFLDMNNWNLQAAIGSYYDIEANVPMQKLPSMSFLQDVTIGEGESVPPSTEFTKTWRVKNPGSDPWPPGACLRFIQGHQLGPLDRVFIDPLEGHGIMDISVRMQSPSHCGLYQGQWRMCTQSGIFFGETIWVILEVREGGMLGLTQQLSSLGTGLMETETSRPPSTDRALANPFGSPSKTEGEDTLTSETTDSPFAILSPSPNKPQNNSHLSSPVRPPVFHVDSAVPNPVPTIHNESSATPPPAVFHDYQLSHTHHHPDSQTPFSIPQSTASFSTLQNSDQSTSPSQFNFHNHRHEAVSGPMADDDL